MTVHAREAARQADGRFGRQVHTGPEVRLTDISSWGTWDDEGFYAIDVEQVGLAPLTPGEQAGVAAVVMAWFDGDRRLGAPVQVPVTSITRSMQPILRRDALQWYTQQRRAPEDTFDDQISFYGADGPLGVRHPDGTVTIVDGNHRFAAALLRGDEAFEMQLLDMPHA